MEIRVKFLEDGWNITHPIHGELTYMGKATKHPYTKEFKKPFKYVFWGQIPENGECPPEIIEMDGELEVELLDGFVKNGDFQAGKIAMCYYYKSDKIKDGLELYWCKVLNLTNYATCILYVGERYNPTLKKGTFNNICIRDLVTP